MRSPLPVRLSDQVIESIVETVVLVLALLVLVWWLFTPLCALVGSVGLVVLFQGVHVIFVSNKRGSQ